MQEFLTLEDRGLLRERGFKAGPTGHAWYGHDNVVKDVWRVYVDPTSDKLMFSVEVGRVWGPASYMTREQFDESFTKH